MRRVLPILLLLALAACGSSRPGAPAVVAPLRPHLGEPISCVPYARARSGIALSGDAWQWWDAAAGRYQRGQAPRPGSVLVLRRTARLASGHLSVVTQVLSGREILVDHANWASGAARGRIATAQRVVDVSPRNDWSLVRVWYPPIAGLGRTAYPADGFVHAETRTAGL
ncbi:CHAP domain-containing protein [Falsiroseomonas selenitidurans]|uniref:CHAP domain-containing protein n=1 Tax=Falsiroseomonas selenitidurans TaxID=2716335 RepID=A0ABX1E3X6_9PROT|nr:CHAP domain-containing protein [Falsiroseomonas selenitidurans]NKC31410.1 CHAP domain-containing protein [Falsiroseomonas selenitidurans]